MRTPVVAGNWKMNLDRAGSEALARDLRSAAEQGLPSEVGVAPPFPYLTAVQDILRDSPIFVAAQNMHWKSGGAFTGEVSGAMLVDLGVSHVILGHSERRHVMGENLEQVAGKVKLALGLGLRPILCVGETLEERQAERTRGVVLQQLETALEGCSEDDLRYLIVAYEPVWAIGTGLNATPEQAGEVHFLIREAVGRRYSDSFAQSLRIQYGGSVKPANAAELLAVEGVDGALVGGASLSTDQFLPIARAPSPAGDP